MRTRCHFAGSKVKFPEMGGATLAEEGSSMTKPNCKPPPGYTLVFRRWRRDPRTGAWMDARRYGYRAWPILVPVAGQ